MKIKNTQIELYLSRLLVLSASVLWYPLGAEEGIKVHHLIIAVLTPVSILSGNLLNHLYQTARLNPVFFVGMVGWLLTLTFTTLSADAAWSPVKVISFFLQVMMSNYAIYRILQSGTMNDLKRLLNFSLLLFSMPFFFLSGIPFLEVINIIVQTVLTANPKIIIFQFLAKAPLFQRFSEDGLDGLRHTISLYFLLVLLVNIIQVRRKFDLAIILFLVFFLAVFQSRSAWVGLTVPFVVLLLVKAYFAKIKMTQWLPIFLLATTLFSGAVTLLAPMILARLQHTDSYSARVHRIAEAWDFLGDLSVAPITMNRMFGSSHMYIFDSYFAGGLFGFIFAMFFIFGVVLSSVPKSKIRDNAATVGFIFAFPLLVRLFTAGSGLPGIGATLCFSIAFYLKYFSNGVQRG